MNRQGFTINPMKNSVCVGHIHIVVGRLWWKWIEKSDLQTTTTTYYTKRSSNYYRILFTVIFIHLMGIPNVTLFVPIIVSLSKLDNNTARVHHCLRSLERVVDWCVSRLVRLICCRIILSASSPGRLLIYDLHVIRLQVLPLLRLGRVR